MKEYTFVSVACTASAGGAKVAFDSHRDIISEYARMGMRYVGWIPTVMDGYGHIKEIDLIFEGKEK